MTNVRPGDLALVVGCPDIPFNGATCEVVGEPPADLPLHDLYGGKYWLVRFGRPMPWMQFAGGFMSRFYEREGSFPDRWLRKLAAPRVVLDVQRESETASA